MIRNSLLKILSCSLLILVLLNSGCNDDGTYVLKKGVGHFSLNLPPGYKVSLLELREDHGYTNVSIDGPWNEQAQSYAAIGILITKANTTYPDALPTLEKSLSFISGWPNFKLLDRSNTQICGISAEQYTCYFTANNSTHAPPDAESSPSIVHEVNIDYGGLIWSFDLNYQVYNYYV